MKKVTVNVLASDFEGNNYFNTQLDMQGCMLQRAFIRSGIIKEEEDYQDIMGLEDERGIEDKVYRMSKGYIPIEDFSFEIEVD